MDAETIEAIADQVHQGWMAEKVRQGFADHVFAYGGSGLTGTLACFYCDRSETYHHDDMLPYINLAENIKAYDRATVRAVLAGIDAAGYAVTPATTTTSEARQR